MGRDSKGSVAWLLVLVPHLEQHLENDEADDHRNADSPLPPQGDRLVLMHAVDEDEDDTG